MGFVSYALSRSGRVVPGAVLRAPLSARTWLGTGYVLTALPVAGLLCGVTVLLAGVAVLGVLTVVLAGPAGMTLVWGMRATTAVVRSRLAAFLGIRLATLARLDRHQLTEFRRPAIWRQLGYHLLAGPLAVVEFVVVAGSWSVGLTLATVWAHTWLLPPDALFGIGIRAPGTLTGLTVLGLAVLLCTPSLVRVVVRLDVMFARALLEAGTRERMTELASRVGALTRSRADMIEAADAERRRIERDLHDGAQQRLVALAMNLGMVRRTATGLPDAVSAALAQAHEDAQQTLTELRDLVRGLHPAVLDDLGLDGALPGIVARSPVPGRLELDLPHRPPPAVEAVAYFVVSEALANVAKHAAASVVEVSVRHHAVGNGPGLVRITVSDNGIGGADPGRGSGLRGLAQRVGSADGTLDVRSPAGGPTVITVELSCAS